MSSGGDLESSFQLGVYPNDYSYYWASHWRQGITVSNCSCDTYPHVSTIFGLLRVCNAPLVPSWVLAVVIGLSSSHKLHNLGPSVPGSLSYAITFVMFALMITSGLFVHCLFLVECKQASVTPAYVDVAKIDGSLTSCIAVSFLYNGLIDLKILPERAFGTVISMVFTYAWVFYAYFAELVPPMQLYLVTVVVCCTLYLITQLALLFFNQCRALGYLFLAGITGGGSLWLTFRHTCWLCQTLGAWSIEGVWYYGSDLAMFLIFLYAWNTRAIQRSTSTHFEDEKTGLKKVMHV